MKKIMLATTLFTLAMFAVATAQQPGSTQSPSSPVPGAHQQSMPGAADQDPGPGSAQQQAPMANAPVTEGCLGGSDPNYTITDTAGNTYKLNIPPSADTSKLAPHVGEPVAVAGNVNKKGSASIDVQGIGRGTSKCPGSGSTGAQTPPTH